MEYWLTKLTIYKNPQRRLLLFCINLTLLILRLSKWIIIYQTIHNGFILECIFNEADNLKTPFPRNFASLVFNKLFLLSRSHSSYQYRSQRKSVLELKQCHSKTSFYNASVNTRCIHAPIPPTSQQLGTCPPCQSWGGALANLGVAICQPPDHPWDFGSYVDPYPNITKHGGFYWKHKQIQRLAHLARTGKTCKGF